MLIFILSLALVTLSSFFITLLLERKENFADFLLFCFNVFLAQIVLVELFLGITGKLFTANILSLELAIALVSFYAYSAKKAKPVFSKPNFTFIFENKIILFAISVFIAFLSYKLYLNLINPPFSPDSLQYHLSFPATWIQNGNLNNPIVIFGSRPTSAELTALSYYPINAELFFFWLMFPLRNAFLADIGEAPFYIIGILAIYSILRKFNLKRETAFLVGMLWALIPNLFKQIKTASQIDVICAVLFLLVLNNLLIFGREFNFKNTCFLGISLGLLVGTKALNLFWAISLLPLFVYFIYLNYARNKWRRILLFLSVIALVTFIFGGFSYLRTFLITGNPFYPVKVIIFGKEVFSGIIDKVTFSKIFVNWEEFRLRNMFFGEGLGLQFLAFIFPGSIVPLVACLFMKRKFENRLDYMLLFLIPAIMLWLYLFYIRAYWIRYTFPYLAMGFIAMAIFLDKFKWGKNYITIIGSISILSSAAELAHRKELIVSLILALLLFIVLLFIRKRIPDYFKKILTLRLALIILVMFFVGLYILNKKYDSEEFLRYPLLAKGKERGQRDIALAWQWLNLNTGSGKRIAYTGRSEFYPLFGTGVKNSVVYISLNSHTGLPHNYPDGLYRKEKDFPAWIDNLKKSGIDYLFIALPHAVNNESGDPKRFPIEDEWAAMHPGTFKSVFSNSLSHIYQVSFKN